jgi:tripartite-type tricarboxylate transporter receptor subunit TctC
MAKFTKILASMATAVSLGAMTAPPVQAWTPSKPINFVIMAGAGGGADQIARFLQSVAQKDHLTRMPLVPVNKGGGSGAEALIELAHTNDPNYTLMVTLNSFFTTPLRQPDLGIDVLKFTPIEMMGVDPFILWVNKSSGITSLDQWVAKVKSMDGKYVMGGTGTGQEDSLVITFLEQAYGLKIKYIPYKGGGTVAKELAGNQIMATVNNPSETKGFYASGDVVPLVAFSDKRLDNFPDVPTIKEMGKDFSYYNQRAVVGAPGMSEEAADYYRDLFTKIYHTKEWQNYMKTESLSPLWMTPKEQMAYWEVQVKRHKELLAKMAK